MGAKCSVEWLAHGVGLVPVDAALGGHIGTDNQSMYTWVARVDAVVYRRTQCVARDEGHAVMAVVYLGGGVACGCGVAIVSECRLGKGVTGCPCEVIVKMTSSQRKFSTQTAATACVDHHSAETVVSGHHRQLQVVHVGEIDGHIHLDLIPGQIDVGSQFVVPCRFGGVGYGFLDILVVLFGMGYLVVATLAGVVAEFGL